MRRIAAYMLIFMLGAAAGLMWRSRPDLTPRPQPSIDTLRIIAPTAVDSAVVRTVTAKLAVSRRQKAAAAIPPTQPSAPEPVDSVEAEMPIVSKEYGDSTYRAWVSGYMPALDSIRIYQRMPPAPKPRRWHLGVSAGVAATGRGVSPYVGIGITYSFISF